MTEIPPRKPWQWPADWVRQESFWREVGTRTLATIFAAGFVYLFALAAGYVSRPDVGRALLFTLGAGLYLVVMPILAQFAGDKAARMLYGQPGGATLMDTVRQRARFRLWSAVFFTIMLVLAFAVGLFLFPKYG